SRPTNIHEQPSPPPFPYTTLFRSMLGKTKALKHIRKYAVVGGPSWVKAMIAIFRPFFSMEMNYFELEEVASAWEWIGARPLPGRSEEHTSELQSREKLVCRLLLEK